MDVTETPLPLDVLRALADPTRLRILEFFLEIGRTPKEEKPAVPYSISGHLGLSQPTVSHHMKVLAEAGLVHAHKKGTKVTYSLADPGLRVLRDFLDPFLEHACPPNETSPEPPA